MNGRSQYLLLSGATGFLGRYLLRDLLMEGQRVAVIVRPSAKQTAQQRIDQILTEWGKRTRSSSAPSRRSQRKPSRSELRPLG